MNILHIISGDFLAGSETYAVNLANCQIEHGHLVYIAGSDLFSETDAEFIPVQIHNRSFFNRIKNVISLVRIIHHHNIDVLHAHSRAASWVACYAAKLTRIAFISTLHGRMHIHGSSKKSNIYGSHAIAVCDDIHEQMLKEANCFQSERVHVIRNGIAV